MRFKLIVLIIVGDKTIECVSEQDVITAIKDLVDNEILFKVDYKYEEEKRNGKSNFKF
jgi:hypothetical protein